MSDKLFMWYFIIVSAAHPIAIPEALKICHNCDVYLPIVLLAASFTIGVVMSTYLFKHIYCK